MNLYDWISSQPPSNLWLFSGLLGLLLGAFIGEPSILALAIAAIITAIVAITVPSFPIQLAIWVILAFCLAIIMRGMVPRESPDLKPPTQGEVSETILPGKMGHVFYEGTLWKARCQISDATLPVGTTVYIVERQGNTLVVLPEVMPEMSFGEAPDAQSQSITDTQL
jgi:membrane protein implicated in regulation of membrane protease activity